MFTEQQRKCAVRGEGRNEEVPTEVSEFHKGRGHFTEPGEHSESQADVINLIHMFPWDICFSRLFSTCRPLSANDYHNTHTYTLLGQRHGRIHGSGVKRCT